MHDLKERAQSQKFQMEIARKILATADVNWIIPSELIRRLREIPELRTMKASVGGWLLRYLVEAKMLECLKETRKTRRRKDVIVSEAHKRPATTTLIKAYRLEERWAKTFLGITDEEFQKRRTSYEEASARREATIWTGAAEIIPVLQRFPQELRWKIIERALKELKKK